MDHLAHIAVWRFGDGSLGVVSKTPPSEALTRDLTAFADYCTYDPILKAVVYRSSLGRVSSLISNIFSDRLCDICFRSDLPPCWHWRTDIEAYLANKHLGWFETAPSLMPASPEAAELLMQQARHGDNAFAQLTRNSATLSSALRGQTVPARPAQRSRAQEAPILATTPVATPVGTIRCHTCGQVIPPGFQKPHDAKTEVEIYESCEHDFDETTNICKKCHLGRRASRFSLLEVD